MLEIFGKPGSFSKTCSNVTNSKLKTLIATQNVGPFKVTGLQLLLHELTEIFDQVRRQNNELHNQVGTEGMLCCRAVRNSKTNYSNHSWGMRSIFGSVENQMKSVTERPKLDCSHFIPFFTFASGIGGQDLVTQSKA